jgi:hypothetical protein
VNAAAVSKQVFSVARPGAHKQTVRVTQDDGRAASADGNIEVIPPGCDARRAKNIITLLGGGSGGDQR